MFDRTIVKFPLAVVDRQEIPMPANARILCVQVQHGAPFLWAMVDTRRRVEGRAIRIVGTGNDTGALSHVTGVYIGTFQMHGGALVWHVFEEAA